MEIGILRDIRRDYKAVFVGPEGFDGNRPPDARVYLFD